MSISFVSTSRNSATITRRDAVGPAVTGASEQPRLDWASLTRSYTVEIGRDVPALAEPWADLERRTGAGAFQSYAWCSAWNEATSRVGGRERPFIVTISDGVRLVLLWPLAIRNLGPLRLLLSFGEPATQYCDALVEPGPDRAALLDLAWEAVCERASVDALLLRGVRSDAAIADVPVLATNRWVTRTADAPFADFRPDCPTGPIRRRSSRTRNALQRHLRNLAEGGAVTFERIEGSAARVSAIREAVRMKQAWLSSRAQLSAGYRHPANAAFLEILAARDDFLVARLVVGADTAAIEAGLLMHGRYWSMVQSYDLRHALHGPGRLLFWHIVERASAMGIEVLDFLAPAYPHKREWSNGETKVRDHVVPLTLGGSALVVYFGRIRPALKTLVTVVPKRSLTKVSAFVRTFRSGRGSEKRDL